MATTPLIHAHTSSRYMGHLLAHWAATHFLHARCSRRTRFECRCRMLYAQHPDVGDERPPAVRCRHRVRYGQETHNLVGRRWDWDVVARVSMLPGGCFYVLSIPPPTSSHLYLTASLVC